MRKDLHAKLTAANRRAKRQRQLDQILDEYPWVEMGYKSKWEFLADKFGDMPSKKLLEAFYAEMGEESSDGI